MESYYKIKDGLDIILTASLYKAKDQLSKACHNYIDSSDYDEQTMLSLLRSYRSFFPISDFLKKTEDESDVIKKIIGDIDIDDITPLDFTKEDITGIIDTIIESIDEKRSEYQRQFNQTIDIDDDAERLQIQMTVMSKRKALTKPKDFFSDLKNLLSEVLPSPNSAIDIDTYSDSTGNDVSPEIINIPADETSSDINSEDTISESETNETYSPKGTVDVPSSKSENHEIDRETLRDAIVKILFARKYLNHNLELISTEEILDQLPYSISQYVTTTRIKRICESDSQISSTGYGTYEYNDGKEKKPVHQPEIIISNEDIKQAIEDFLYEHKDDIFHPDGFASEDILDMLPDNISENISVEIIDDIAPKCEHIIMPSFGYYMYDNRDDSTEENDSKLLPETIVEEDNETDTEKIANIADTVTIAPEAEIETVHILSNTDNIHFTLNNREYYAFDWSEVLCKVCEYFIRKAPFRMARIAGVQIYHNGQMVFYRKSVPVDGYCKLTNGLQVMKISSKEDFNAIYNDISEYCQIFDEIVFD